MFLIITPYFDIDTVIAAAAARIGPRYAPLAAGYVPKSFKSGADFRVYPSTVEDPTATHSAELMHMRLASGARKRVMFAQIIERKAIR